MRILILSLKAGAGHIRAAQAIEEAIREQSPGAQVQHIESLSLMTSLYRIGFNAIYGSILKWMPSLWRVVYEHTEKQPPWNPRFTRLNAGRLIRTIQNFDPDCIVCTHFLPAALAAKMHREGKLRASVAVVLTDYDIHKMWIHRGVGHYFVANAETAYALHRKDVPTASVTISGIPTLSSFRKKQLSRDELRKKLNLDASRPVVLVTGGGCGLGELDAVVRALAAEYPLAQYLAVAGNNPKVFASLKTLAAQYRGIVTPFGFVSNIDEMMAASNLAITKPGGLTITECLAMALPTILINPIPGQEEHNAKYLLETGAALQAHNLSSLLYKVREVLANPQILARMSLAACNAAAPSAALTIAEKSIELAQLAPGLANAPSPAKNFANLPLASDPEGKPEGLEAVAVPH